MLRFGGGGGGITVTESADKTYALSSSYNHTFASTPKLYGAYMRCTTAENGHSIGDRVDLATGLNYDGATLSAVSVYVRGATVYVSNRSYIWGANASGSAEAVFSTGKWVIVIWAIL